MKKISNSFITGTIALVFAVLGYQTALLVHYAATARVIANRDCPDTVFISKGSHIADSGGYLRAGDGPASGKAIGYGNRLTSNHSEGARRIREGVAPRHPEAFRFNPNTVSSEELVRLGFSPKQAGSIVNYRNKGGRFRRKEDFRKSYAVSEEIFARLESYIDIPLVDINEADSATFDDLPGIGGYFARKMVEYRDRLGGYSFPEQLMDIYHFDREKYNALEDLICLSPPTPFKLWSLPADSLKSHPYIGGFATARSIVFYREHNPREAWSVEGLVQAGVLDSGNGEKLKRCRLE